MTQGEVEREQELDMISLPDLLVGKLYVSGTGEEVSELLAYSNSCCCLLWGQSIIWSSLLGLSSSSW